MEKKATIGSLEAVIPAGRQTKGFRPVKLEIAILLLFVSALAMIAYAMAPGRPSREELRSLCDQKGGISVIGDHGGFKVCLRPEVVIELPKE